MKKAIIMLTGVVCFALLCSNTYAVVKVRVAIQNAETAWGCMAATNDWLKAIPEVTNGEVVLDVYYNNTLCNSKDAWQATKNGITDMAWCVQGYWPGLTPLVEVVTLPGLPYKTSEAMSGAAYQLLEEFPEIRAEFAGFQPLILHLDPHVFVSSKKPVSSMDDLKAMKVRVLGGPPTMQFTALKATPILMPMPDIYMSLQKGTLDGGDLTWESILAFRFYELVDKYLEAPLGPSLITMIMNTRKWDMISPESQAAIMAISGVNGSAKWGKNWSDNAKVVVLQRAKELRPYFEFISLEDAALQQWIDVSVTPIHKEWVADMQKRGYTRAQQILDRYIELGHLSQQTETALNP